MFRVRSYEREGEPGGGGTAVIDAPAPADAPSQPSFEWEAAPADQPDVSPEAALPIPEGVDGAAKEEPGVAEPKADQSKPVQLDPKVVKAIVEAHPEIAEEALGDRIARREQAASDRARALASADPAADPEWQQYTGRVAQSYQAIVGELEQLQVGHAAYQRDLARFHAGEIAEMPKPPVVSPDLAQHVANTTVYTQAAERRAARQAVEARAAVFERQILGEDGKGDGLDPQLVRSYRELRAQGDELRNRYERSGDRGTREKANAVFLDHILPAMLNLALADGKKRGADEVKAQFARDLTIKTNLAGVEAYARLQEHRPAPGNPGVAAGAVLTPEQYAALSPEQAAKLTPEQIDAIWASSTAGAIR